MNGKSGDHSDFIFIDELNLLTSNPKLIVLDNVKGSTGTPALVDADAAAAAAASDSFCSRSLFFLFSSYKMG